MGERGEKKETCTEEAEEKRNGFGDMATLCTEIGMPKYRENKKKWKCFLPGNIPANICHRQCLVCEGVCVLYSMCQPCARLCTRCRMLRNTYSCCVRACTSVYRPGERVCLCDSIWMSAGVCIHTRQYLCFYMYIQSLLSSFPAHFVRARQRAQSYVYSSVCKANPSVFMHTSNASSFTPYL